MEQSCANILAVQPYGYIENDQDMGSGAVGSRARLLYAAMLVGAGKIPKKDLIAVFPQSWRSDPPSAEVPAKISLGQMMAEYLKTRPEMEGVMIVHQALSWGTKNDIINTYNMARIDGNTRAHISFVSDPVHIKRVKLIWKHTHPQDWTADFYGATFHVMTRQERWRRETLARLFLRWQMIKEKTKPKL